VCGRVFQLGVSLMLAGALIGCKTTPPPQPKDRPDPLLHSKVPIEGQAHDVDAEATVRVNPLPPPIPNQPNSAIVQNSK
jgi:hypothetical protein